MDADEIRDLPASWYAEQDIPPRLLAALGRPYSIAWVCLPRDVGRALMGTPKAKRSPVEQAHVRATNRLGRPK